MRYLIVMLLWMGTSRCLSEAGTEPKARLNSEGEAAARAEADEKLFASWIEEVEKGGMRLVHPIGELGLELLKGGQEAGEAEVNGVGVLSFVESESVTASDESLRYLIKLLKSDKPGVVPLIGVDGTFAIRDKSNRLKFIVCYFNEMKDVFGAGVMIWKLNYAGGFRCKGVKSPIEFYQRLPGLEFRAVYVSQKELDQFVRLVKGPAKNGK